LAHHPGAGDGHFVRVLLVHSKWEIESLLLFLAHANHQAPGEAEAELARLNSEGIVDAVLTEDSDAFIFGATHVIRKSVPSQCIALSPQILSMRTLSHSPVLTDSKDEITVYTADAIRAAPDLSLTRGGMLLITLLSGGDYDPVSITSCRLLFLVQ
jgi:holliday junction resolvase YEN1